MTFKEKWEKADQRVRIEKPLIEAMLARALPGRKLASHEIISGGCANLNIKIEFEKGEPFILRIYLRDKEAAFREQRLAALVRQTVPVPDICFVGDVENYRFALAEYKKGITLRDLLMSEKGMECME